MLTIKEVSGHLQCSRLVIEKLVVQGLPCVNISASPLRRRLRFDLVDVQDWLKENRTRNWQSAKAKLEEAESVYRRAKSELSKLQEAGEEPDEDEETVDDGNHEDTGDGDTNET